MRLRLSAGALLVLSLATATGCGKSKATHGCAQNADCQPAEACIGGSCVATGTDGGLHLDGGTCTASVSTVMIDSAHHVPQGSAILWDSNPPAGGDHYPEWLRWARRYEVVERGNYVHNEEHGGVVLINPCPSGCDEVSAALESIGRSLAQDPACAPPINARWVVVRDPMAPAGAAVAAVAWGRVFTAPCFDEAAIRAFIATSYDKAPESTCAEGSRP